MFSFVKGNTDLLSENVTDKKVLVLGSGPSAREVDWKSEEWDVLVTTSFFYLNEEVLSKKPVHVTLSDIVDLENESLQKYLDDNLNCTIGFEPKHHPFYESKSYKDFISKYGNRVIYYNVHGDKEGVAARLCWLILSCEPSGILLCGIDGISKTRENDPQNYFRNHNGTMDKYPYDMYYTSFQTFAEKLYSTAKDMSISIKNLGKGKPYNMFSNVSEKYEI
jgi:hypothetical protein